MNKFSVDYDELEQEISKPKAYRYEDVKDKIVRVAYDIVRFESPEEDIDALWQVQSTDDGEVIVAMYDKGDGSTSVKTSESSWSVVPDSNKNVHIFYKNHMIKRIASTDININEEDISSFCKGVGERLANDKAVRASLLDELPNLDRMDLFSKYPELTE